MSLTSGGKLVGQYLHVVISVYGTTPSRRRLVERPENAPSLLMCARYDPHQCWRAGGVPKARMEKVELPFGPSYSLLSQLRGDQNVCPSHNLPDSVATSTCRDRERRAHGGEAHTTKVLFPVLVTCLGGRDSHYIRPDHAQSPSLAGDQRGATRCSRIAMADGDDKTSRTDP
ncbi:hypothetical protein GGP41_002347 [Bipolaris sorokiniana]|uniref:Uncharacterized protein n=1 Tax=Cochliobolus sativus TaxID=45130 RepID=A0A8H5ZJ35_COCSA|nr:hypothetical protein GGP41_002347 [Bipolaris sorokiniana]